MTGEPTPIGWILRASASEFVAGCRLLEPQVPRFGDLVKAPVRDVHIFGLIYDVQVQDDLSVRQMILAGGLEPEAVLDQRENRLVPIELSVLVVGYQHGQKIVHGLPPQPPLSLDILIPCTDTDLRAFTGRLDYLHLILNAAHLPVDELLVVHLQQAARSRAAETRRPFLVQAGRELARLLTDQVTRLDSILRRLGEVAQESQEAW
ncbi:MAG: hypothetical protein D6784_12620 [Chloroflexi bacterium]|nr:MAG: hypothetical protein D6784_12620 [Chloroflexota bacterium]